MYVYIYIYYIVWPYRWWLYLNWNEFPIQIDRKSHHEMSLLKRFLFYSRVLPQEALWSQPYQAQVAVNEVDAGDARNGLFVEAFPRKTQHSSNGASVFRPSFFVSEAFARSQWLKAPIFFLFSFLQSNAKVPIVLASLVIPMRFQLMHNIHSNYRQSINFDETVSFIHY